MENSYPLIDSHCHLNFECFLGVNLDAVLARAAASNVGAMQTICIQLSEFETVLELTNDRDYVWCSVGTHPHHAKDDEGVAVERYVELATQFPKVISIGECGLDYHYCYSDKEVQKEVFRRQLLVCRICNFPVVIHTREADEDTIEILKAVAEVKPEQYLHPLRGVLHCFSSGKALLDYALSIGFYVSFSGMITMKWAQDLGKLAAEVPLDRLLVETDSPFLAPIPKRGKTNEPSFVRFTAAKLASLKNVSVDEITRVTSKNFFHLFDKARPIPSSFRNIVE